MPWPPHQEYSSQKAAADVQPAPESGRRCGAGTDRQRRLCVGGRRLQKAAGDGWDSAGAGRSCQLPAGPPAQPPAAAAAASQVGQQQARLRPAAQGVAATSSLLGHATHHIGTER